ncbi:hypothetical protein D3Z51_03915 [Clostridiaceae bacterium]|nr:hypothetical protein [Clostridiaceae bacterium]RKI13351.1 hypothetical protein D7V81_10390 [bacterium 1XD21-70]
MKKLLAGFGMAALLSCALAGTALAAWEQDETGYSFRNDSGSYARSQIMEIEGVRYGFNEQAYMVTGWAKFDSNWYYFEPSGAMALGWKQLDGKWYYLNAEKGGTMQVSWMNLGPKRYYFREDGSMVTGSFDVDGLVYFAEPTGELRRNTYAEENGITIRYDEDGREWYKNKENEVNNKGGGELWLPVLAGEALSRQRESVQQDNMDLIEGVKEELYEEYKEKVLSVSYKSKARESRRTKWEEKVKRELTKYAVPEQEIAEFIAQVKSDYFGSDAYYEEDEEDEDDYEDDYE